MKPLICKGCGATEYESYNSIPRWCKECWKIHARSHRSNNVERYRAYDRERGKLPHRLDLNTRTVRRMRIEHPERYTAHNAVNNAVRNGRLQPLPCWVCGLKAVAHHPDYSLPLDVVWLCQAHHKQAHALARATL